MNPASLSIPMEKLARLNWWVLVFLALLGGVGVAMLYSASGGEWTPWARTHGVRLILGIGLAIAVGLTPIQYWLKAAWWIYGGLLLALILVELLGTIGMGAQRWLVFGSLRFQPSEAMKIAMVLVLARYFHGIEDEEIIRLRYLVVPVLVVAVPVLLVARQPDLGTAAILLAGGGILLFLSGIRVWKFGLAAALGALVAPVVWGVLKPYQRDRILTFLSPENDPLGAGYHITQSKIALGSGGLAGKGFVQGTQSHLNFLPEKHTDFVFAMLAEELGLLGSVLVIGSFFALVMVCFVIARNCRHQFGRLLAAGVGSVIFLYAFVNMAMVMSLIPVVGVPLPLVSYGGTAMLTVCFGLGVVLCVHINRGVWISRAGVVGD